MAKGLCNIHQGKDEAIRRRLANPIRGLGFWGAVDATLRGVAPVDRRLHQNRLIQFTEKTAPIQKDE